MDMWLALLLARVVGTIFNFFTTGGFVFRLLSFNRFPRFVACHLFVYGINLLLMDVASIFIYNKIISQTIISIPLALLSYFLMNRFVFYQK
jgi:putative flippase GtrA